jgi:hypothetical protein
MKSLLQIIALCLATLHIAKAFAPTQHRNAASSTALSSISFPQLKLPDFLNNNNKTKQRNELKSQILDLAAQTNRGLAATPSQQEQLLQLFIQLERLNPTPSPLRSPLVNGNWDLKYTTSSSILGRGGFPRIGPIIQTIDVDSLSARNSEVVRYFLLDVPRSVEADLSPVNGQLTNVQFKQFDIGGIKINAPEGFRGSLDVTYLDEEMRLTRGDKGNIFVLTRM